MKKAEKESFAKSFSIFFTSLTLLISILGYLEYGKLKHEQQEQIYNAMRICSYDLKCNQYDIEFVAANLTQMHQLFVTDKELYAIFPIPKNENYALKISLKDTQYKVVLKELAWQVLSYYLIALSVIFLISIFFSWYTLYPLKHALHLTEEFSRDILHDLGTPLASLRLNVSRLKGVQEDQKKIIRITQSIDTITSLGDNLRAYLEENQTQREIFDLQKLIYERMQIFERLFVDRIFSINEQTFYVFANKDALSRIIDNLLSNAAKYNISNGFIKINIDAAQYRIVIEDSGKGIADPKRVFERFYKEHERGVGIGLHIVEKIAKDMKIEIQLQSQLDIGTTVILNLEKISIKNYEEKK